MCYYAALCQAGLCNMKCYCLQGFQAYTCVCLSWDNRDACLVTHHSILCRTGPNWFHEQETHHILVQPVEAHILMLSLVCSVPYTDLM